MPDRTYNLGSRKHVFIDWDLIEPGYGVHSSGAPVPWEMPSGVELAVHYPRIEPRPIISPDKPWESSVTVQASLIEDEGRHRLYYLCRDWSAGRQPSGYMVYYAESTDGVTWHKPNIGTVEFKGSRENNIVYGMNIAQDRPTTSPAVFKDPSAPPDQRYKLTHRARENGVSHMFGAVSADGLRWKALEKPLLSGFASDTHNVMAFNPDRGRYVGYFRGGTNMDNDEWTPRRTIAYSETDRFETWPLPKTIVTADMNDGPDTDIYTNAYTPWPGADAHLMFPAFFQRRLDTFELHMMTSRDGLRWQRPSRGPIIPTGEPGSDSEGMIAAGNGLAELRPGEWSLPIGPRAISHNQHRSPEEFAKSRHMGYIGLATWRRDGFVSLEAKTEGTCTTVPIDFTGSRLEVNAWTRYGGEIRFELADVSADDRRTAAETVPGRTFEDCDPIFGDHLKHTVTWRGDSDLSAWAGKPVRMRLQMRRARLYAIQFV